MILSHDIYRQNRKVILASGSPRRREILSIMGVTFETAGSGVEDERAYIDVGDLDASLCRLAAAKTREASERCLGAVVLAADTIVVVDGEVLGKPVDKNDARRMLFLLSGKRHTVVTAVALVCDELGFSESVAARTDVFFRALDGEEVEHYLSYQEYKDKAGAYAVQGKAMTFIDRIEGCYYNVMGLPVTATLDLFKMFVKKGDLNGGKQRKQGT